MNTSTSIYKRFQRTIALLHVLYMHIVSDFADKINWPFYPYFYTLEHFPSLDSVSQYVSEGDGMQS